MLHRLVDPAPVDAERTEAIGAQYAGATWFELARATSDAHRRALDAHRAGDRERAALEDERFRVLQGLLGDATERCRQDQRHG
jgi:hypothetical protein